VKPDDVDNQEKIAGRRMLAVTEEELQRIVLDIHDGAVQRLFAALSQVNYLQQQVSHATDADWEAHALSLARIAALLEDSLTDIRTFLGAFRPPEFAKRDLLYVLRALILQFESTTGNRVDFAVSGPIPEVSLPIKIALYRILQEALSNSDRHSGVKAQRVRLWTESQRVCLEVSDTGAGFDPPQLVGPGATEREEHIGLRGMRDRVALVSGTFALWSRPGSGTRVTVRVPCE
jgi:signal transduction histidine kinase